MLIDLTKLINGTSNSIAIDCNVNIDKSYLARLFKEKRNETVMPCLTNCRMAEAERILQSTAYSVREVALFCGFADEFYFSRVFRKHFGVSPSEYRKNLR